MRLRSRPGGDPTSRLCAIEFGGYRVLASKRKRTGIGGVADDGDRGDEEELAEHGVVAVVADG